MGWKETGDDRAKRYQAYKDLEQRLIEAQQSIALLTEDLASRDITIRTLAKELYRSVSNPGEHGTIPPSSAASRLASEALEALPAADTEPPPKRSPSGTMASVQPRSLAEVFGQATPGLARAMPKAVKPR